MRNLTKENITEAFLKATRKHGDDSNPRTVEIMACLAKHLHAFANETRLTHEEWNKGIDFLKRVSEMTTPQRDEFILLSDVLGLSSLVDLIHNNKQVQHNEIEKNFEDQSPSKKFKTYTKVPTSSSVLGPFHLENPPKLPMGADLKRDNEGELMLVQGQVLDATTGNPIQGATINVWQTASNGMYSSQDPNQDTYNFHGFLSSTSESGAYQFTTVKPVSYQIPTDGPVGVLLRGLGRHAWRPSHLHFIVKAEGYHTLVTELFPKNDKYLDEDAVFGVRKDLILTLEKRSPDSFPEHGFELSAMDVKEYYLAVEFDLVLMPTHHSAHI